MIDFLVYFVNVVVVQVLIDVGFEFVINLVKDMGIKFEVKVIYFMVLGSWEVNLLELINVYVIFVVQGKYILVYGIKKVIN